MNAVAVRDQALTACTECDLLYVRRPLARHEVARCHRCGAVLFEGPGVHPHTSLALWVTAALLFAMANLFPLLTLRLQGQIQVTSLIGATFALANAGMPFLATIVGLTTIAVPMLEIAGMLYVLAPLSAWGPAPGSIPVFRWLEWLRPWGMVEVYLLAVLISVVKLASLASVEPGIALFAFAGLVFAAIGALATLDAEAVWQRLSPA